MHPTTIQAKHSPKANAGPLWIFHPAFAALVITRNGFDYRLVMCGHLHHDGEG